MTQQLAELRNPVALAGALLAALQELQAREPAAVVPAQLAGIICWMLRDIPEQLVTASH